MTSAWVHQVSFFYGFSLILEADDIVQCLHLTRDAEGRLREVYGNDCFQAEPEPMCSEEEESTLGFSDCEEAMEDEFYPPMPIYLR